MKTLLTRFITVILIITSVACHSESKYADDLKQIEPLVEESPQLALEKLQKLCLHINDAPISEQMKYTLLRIKAEDKLFVLQESDSTMLAIVDYYESHGTDEDLLQAYYLMAAAYRDMHDSPKAIEYYMKAAELGDKHSELKDHPILARSYGLLATLLTEQGNMEEALSASKKAFLHSSPDDHDAAHELAEHYLTAGKRDSALIYFDLARQNCLKNEKNTRWVLELFGSQLGIFIKTNDQLRIADCLNIVKQYPDSLYPISALSGLALYYNSREQYDSACYYWEKCRDCNPSLWQLKGISKNLTNCYLKRGMKDEAIKYANKVAEVTDSIYGDVVIKQSSNAYNQFVYSKNEKKTLMERERIWQYAFAGYFVLSIIAALSLWIYYRNRIKLKETIKTKDALMQKNEELTEANTSLEVKLQENILRVESIDARALAQALHNHANESGTPSVLTKKELQAIYHSVELNYPETVERINSTLPGISPFDRSLLYILKLGLNQSEAARLLDRKRSTISHRLAVIEKSYNIPPKSILDIDMDFARSLHDGFL